MNPDRPLDGIRSIKAKLALLVGASIVAASLVSEIGDRAGVSVWLTVPVTVAAALGVTQWLARGMTSPLREMTEAAAGMATGDYSRRVTASSADEVGTLATAFNTMAADLASADQQRRQLVATVSHELRTPLAAQQALLENLVDGVVRPDDDVLRNALAQAERLGGLVGDLLDLSRVDGGRSRLHLAAVRVADLVEQGVAEASVSGRPVEHAVTVTPPDLTVEADAARLAQVLANLLDNAARHSTPGGIVHVAATTDGPGRWALEVSDEGPGIPRDRAARIFDRFGPGDDSGGGTGIGLAIASWVCELHGGSIAAVAPRPGQSGARIRAVLPVHPRPPRTRAERSPSAPPPPPSPAPEMSTSTLALPHRAPPADPSSWEPPMPSGAASTPSSPSSPSGQVTVSTAAPQPISPPGTFVDSLFGDLWPEAGLGPQVGVLLGSVAVGILAAAVLPYRQIGVALVLVLLAGATLVWRTSARKITPWSIATTVVCFGLAALVVLRAAEWVTVLAIAAGVVLTTTALTGARGLLPMAAALAGWPLAALRGLPLLGRTIAATSRVTILWPLVRTTAVSLVALVVFGGLFASGDAIFGSWVGSFVPDVVWDSLIVRSFVGFVVGGALLAVGYLALNPPRVGRLVVPAGRAVARTWEWAAPVGLVITLITLFVVAQAAALFGGHEYVRRTTGLTYAEYVHQGFGQLTAATLLTLVTVALVARKAPRLTSRERLQLRAMLGALCLLTLVVVASALHRMDLYQQAYGFTVLRVVVDGFELWLGLLVVLVILAGVRLSAAWLPRAALLSGALFVLVAGLANPEAWVAQRNLDRYQATGKLDVRYLEGLGPDAAPTIAAGLPAPLARCVLADEIDGTRDDLLGWNLGRAMAAALPLSAVPATGDAACAALVGEVNR